MHLFSACNKKPSIRKETNLKEKKNLSCLNRQQCIISHLQSLLGCLNDSILITKKEQKGKKREQQDPLSEVHSIVT